MVSDDLAGSCHHLSLAFGQCLALLGQIGVNELLVVATGNEADLLRVWLLSHGRRQAVTMRQLAHLRLAQMTKRKSRAAELLLL